MPMKSFFAVQNGALPVVCNSVDDLSSTSELGASDIQPLSLRLLGDYSGQWDEAYVRCIPQNQGGMAEGR